MGGGASSGYQSSYESHFEQSHNNPLLKVLTKYPEYHLPTLKKEIEKVIRDNGVDCLNEDGAFGLSPLYCAADTYDHELFQFLKKMGANIDRVSSYDYLGYGECSLLHFAMLEKRPQLVKFLLENGCDINPREEVDIWINSISNEEAKKEIHDLVVSRRECDEEEAKKRNSNDTSHVTNPIHSGVAAAIDSSEISVAIDDPRMVMNPLRNATIALQGKSDRGSSSNEL